MLVSYKWLQTYFKNPLPSVEDLVQKITFSSFEIEGVEKKGEDSVLDVKVLPDRACYALSHEGIAKEIAAILNDNKFIPRNTNISLNSEMPAPAVVIENKNICKRYIASKVMNVSAESPAWLKERLNSVGQRSINLLVDLTNFVMLDIGEPMHVFDAEKIVGKIIVRDSIKDEKIELLDGKEISIPEGTLLICDEKGPLVVAGIRGGKRAEVGVHTRSVFVEAANFDATSVRKTSSKIGIKTDSSKRFENNVSVEKALEGMKYFLELLKKEDPEILISEINDQNFSNEIEKTLEVPFEKVRGMLGSEINNQEIIDCLNRVGLRSEMSGEMILVRVPVERKDINIPEDITEEVGRIFGYEKIVGILPEIKNLYIENKNISVQTKIRNFLVGKGFSEIITYSLVEKGEKKLANPLALDKGCLRSNLSDSIEEKLTFNLYSSDLLNANEIRIFEIGKIFLKEGEKMSLAIGVAYKKTKGKSRPNDEIKIVRDELFEALNLNLNTVCTVDDTGGLIMSGNKQVGVINNKDGIFEIDLDFIISLINKNEDVFLESQSKLEKYQPFSVYPFIVRDIAIFVPGENKEEEILKIIKIQAGELLMKENLFDVFTKTDEHGEKKTSYAFRLIFQSFYKTLTEKEVEEIMYRITAALNSYEGWKVR